MIIVISHGSKYNSWYDKDWIWHDTGGLPITVCSFIDLCVGSVSFFFLSNAVTTQGEKRAFSHSYYCDSPPSSSSLYSTSLFVVFMCAVKPLSLCFVYRCDCVWYVPSVLIGSPRSIIPVFFSFSSAAAGWVEPLTWTRKRRLTREWQYVEVSFYRLIVWRQ